ncbi:MAG TPA: hypothetical protein DCZ19_02595 [Porphyromonadaceae bacterium]|nr:hypothetical protein [Porphyromonadaceae bacterium]HCC17963.1 hypothetical protein [Porphyromonadaceae bacterium]
MAKKQNRQKFTHLLIIAAILFGVIIIFSRSTTLSEWYMQHIYPAVAIILSTLSGLFPFSLYDLFILVASLYLIVLILFLIFRKTSFKKFLYSLIRFVTMLVVWFYFAWGISYFREDFYAKSDLKETTFDAENLKKFVIRFVADANEAYVDFDVMDRAGVRQDLEESYHALHEKLGIDYPNGKRRAKPMLFESLYSKMGVSGYFGPFFNEIHVNNYSLDTTYPFTLAHEMAHQFGIAHESEANLYAFIVCMQSEDERIRYSAYLLTLLYLVNDAAEFLPEEVDSLTSAIRPEIIADLRRNREHWLAVRNRSLSEVQDKAYDAYLKTNKVSSGRENYSEVVGLLISSYDTFIKK